MSSTFHFAKNDICLITDDIQWPKETGFATTHYPQCHSYSVNRGGIQLNMSHPIKSNISGQAAKNTNRSHFSPRKIMKMLKDGRYAHSDVLCFVVFFNKKEMEKKDMNPDYRPTVMVGSFFIKKL